MSLRRLALGIALLATINVASCRADKGPSEPEDASAPQPASEPSLEPALPPADVSGSYLVGCSASTSLSFFADEPRAANLAACVMRDKDGKLAENVSDVTVTATIDGKATNPTLIAKETNAPWHVGFSLPREDIDVIQNISVKFKVGENAKADVSTDNVKYDWLTDPLFAEFVALIRGALVLLKLPATLDQDGEFQKAKKAGAKTQIIFLTDNAYRGNVGFENADAHCREAGKRIDPSIEATTLLSTQSSAARDRVKILGLVYNFAGSYIGDGDNFWRTVSEATVRYTETGRSVDSGVVYPDDPSLGFVFNAWTGSTSDTGSFDPTRGNCNDWTSESPSVTGATLFAPGVSEKNRPIYSNLSLRCDQYARLICISKDSFVPNSESSNE